jgi:hypothetical protein
MGYGITLCLAALVMQYQRYRLAALCACAAAILVGIIGLLDAFTNSQYVIMRAVAVFGFGLAVLAGGLLLIYRQKAPLAGLLVSVALMPIYPIADNWSDNEQRDHFFGFWFGHDMFKPPFAEANGKPLYPEMARNAVLFGGTDPGRFNPTYMIFCDSFMPPEFLPMRALTPRAAVAGVAGWRASVTACSGQDGIARKRIKSVACATRDAPQEKGGRNRPFFRIRREPRRAATVAPDALGRERRSAAAGRGRVRVLDHELLALYARLVVDLRPRQVLEAHRIDEQRDTTALHAGVVVAPLLVEGEPVLEARAPAALDEYPQLEVGVALLVDQLLHLGRRGFGEHQRFRHRLGYCVHVDAPGNCTTFSDLPSS